MADPRPVPRGLRVLNLLVLFLFLAGAGLYARAWVGMHRLTSYQPTLDEPLFSAMARFDRLWGLSITGTWLVSAAVLGAVAVAVALVVHRRREDEMASPGPRPNAQPEPQPNP